MFFVIGNEKGYKIRVKADFNSKISKNELILQMVNDWNEVMDFDFDNFEQIDLLIEALNSIKEI